MGSDPLTRNRRVRRLARRVRDRRRTAALRIAVPGIVGIALVVAVPGGALAAPRVGAPASGPEVAAVHDGPQGSSLHAAATVTPISRSQIVANANNWYVAADDPGYNQAGYWQSRTVYAGDAAGNSPKPGGVTPAWREDCSGFVAHAWGEVDSGGGFTTYTAPAYVTPISWSQLEPGDAILFNSTAVPNYGTVDHIGLFMGWDTATTYSVMDESTPGSGTQLQHGIPVGSDTFWQYGQPVRYNGVGTAPGSGAGSGPSGSSGSAAPNRVGTSSTGGGYWLAGSNGATFAFGSTPVASTPALPLGHPIVGMAATRDGNGYYLVASDGGIFTFGDAHFAGSTGAVHLNQPIVGMATDPATGGYWLVASDGGIFTFDAPFLGSTGAIHLNKPIVGMAATPDGNGYYLVASDGGIFTFGDAHFAGSTGAVHLNQPIVGMATDPATGGYWLVASDGGIFTFDAPFLGSTGAIHLNKPIVGMAATPDGNGYYLVASDGGIFTFGDAHFAGSTGALASASRVIGIIPVGG